MNSKARSEEPLQEETGPAELTARRYAGILAGYVDSLNAGESPDVADLLDDHPDLAADLRKDIRLLSRLRRTMRNCCD